MHTSGAEQIDALRSEADGGQVNLVESDRLRRGRLHHVQHVQGAVRQPERPPGRGLLPRPRHLQQGPQPGPVHDGVGPVRHRARSATSRTPGSPSTTWRRPRTTSPSTRRRPARTSSSPSCRHHDPCTIKSVQFLQEKAEKAGMKVIDPQVEQAALINTALGGDWQAHVLAQPPRRQPRRPVRLVDSRLAGELRRHQRPRDRRAARRRAGPSPTRTRPPADLRGRSTSCSATRSTTSGSTGRSGTSPRPPTWRASSDPTSPTAPSPSRAWPPATRSSGMWVEQ